MKRTLLGLSKSWHSYKDSVNGQEKLPRWERLWSDLVLEKIRQGTSDGSSLKNEDEENCALAAVRTSQCTILTIHFDTTLLFIVHI